MTDRTRFHFIGIGGAGMSAIAHILHSRGELVTGSDRQESDVTRRLRALGIRVDIGHNAEAIDGAQVVVYTPAIAADNPEFVEARKRGLTVIERPAMLGRLMQPYKHRIAVSGAHGKTSTTSMITAVLERAGLEPTAFIGGDVSFLGGNARLGGGQIVVAEACEAFGSFLHLGPSIAVITNVDADHLDYYGTVEAVEDAFRKFLAKVDPDGCVVAYRDDERTAGIVAGCGRRTVSFGLHPGADVQAVDLDLSHAGAAYDLVRGGEKLSRIELSVPGKHNVLNSLAAATVAFELDAPVVAVADALRDFRGAGRRFEILYERGGVMVVDDYAHHPAEISETLQATRSAYNSRIIAIFQPHLYSRTQVFLDGFAESLSAADEVILIPIYPAREEPIEGVSSDKIVERMRNRGFSAARYFDDVSELPRQLASGVKPGQMLLFLGAGDIRESAERTAEILAGEARR